MLDRVLVPGFYFKGHRVGSRQHFGIAVGRERMHSEYHYPTIGVPYEAEATGYHPTRLYIIYCQDEGDSDDLLALLPDLKMSSSYEGSLRLY